VHNIGETKKTLTFTQNGQKAEVVPPFVRFLTDFFRTSTNTKLAEANVTYVRVTQDRRRGRSKWISTLSVR